MEYGDKFRKSFIGGFNKKDVLRCLKEMHENHVDEQGQLTEENQALSETLSTLRAENAGLKAEQSEQARILSECEEKIERSIEENSRTRQENEALQKEVCALRAANSELAMKKEVLENHNRRMKEQLQALEKALEEEKALVAKAQSETVNAENLIRQLTEISRCLRSSSHEVVGKLNRLVDRLETQRENEKTPYGFIFRK